MGYVIIILKLIIGFSILNVWLIQPQKATKYRGGDSKNIIDEFKAYGFSKSFCYIIGFLKITLAIILLFSVYFKNLTLLGSLGLALLLLGSVLVHIKIKDPLYKSFPAALFLVMNLIIVWSSF